MRTARNWKDYEMIDTSGGEKLERWNDVILIRPDPQVIWGGVQFSPLWKKADARYLRSNKGGGEWKYFRRLPQSWTVSYNLSGPSSAEDGASPLPKNLKFHIRPTGFKHTGLFPEQAVNWDYFAELIQNAGRPVRVLNLFAYTGGATLACAAAGAEVCHVDASKGMVQWARDNASLSNLSDKPIRWIVDDCEKFVQREIRRGSRYDAVIMDPPSYGRGPSGEIWKLEEKIHPLVELCAGVMSEHPLFFALNSYTTGLSPSVMEYLLGITVARKFGGRVSADEIGLPVTETGYILPCGSTALWTAE